MKWVMFLCIFYFGSWLFSNLHIRAIFVALGIKKHGNGRGPMTCSWKRKKAYYKRRWTFRQRLFMIPILQQRVGDMYLLLFGLNAFHFLLSMVLTTIVVLSELLNTQLGDVWVALNVVFAVMVFTEISCTFVTSGIKYK